MSPEKMIGLSFAAAAAKGYEVLKSWARPRKLCAAVPFIFYQQEVHHAEFLHDAQLRRHAL